MKARVELDPSSGAVEAEIRRRVRRHLRVAAELEPVPFNCHEGFGTVFPPRDPAIALAISCETSIQGHDCTVRSNQGSAGTEAEQGPRVEVELEILLEVQAADREPAVLKETARRELEVVAPLRSLVVDLADDRI